VQELVSRPRSYVTRPGYKRGMRPPNYGRKYPAEPLSRDEVGLLLGACSRRAPTGVRNRALIVVMWRSGLRVAEALALKPADIDLAAGTVRVLHGKGDRARTVGIDQAAVDVIDRWIQVRRSLGIPPSAPLFCVISEPTKGGPLAAAYVREMMKHLARKVGIEKRVHPHGLRHTHAAELAREGVPVHYIKRQLGHQSLAVTERYIDHLTPTEVIDAVHARPAW
jgi:site-specific recombinase XerD